MLQDTVQPGNQPGNKGQHSNAACAAAKSAGQVCAWLGASSWPSAWLLRSCMLTAQLQAFVTLLLLLLLSSLWCYLPPLVEEACSQVNNLLQYRQLLPEVCCHLTQGRPCLRNAHRRTQIQSGLNHDDRDLHQFEHVNAVCPASGHAWAGFVLWIRRQCQHAPLHSVAWWGSCWTVLAVSCHTQMPNHVTRLAAAAAVVSADALVSADPFPSQCKAPPASAPAPLLYAVSAPHLSVIHRSVCAPVAHAQEVPHHECKHGGAAREDDAHEQHEPEPNLCLRIECQRNLLLCLHLPVDELPMPLPQGMLGEGLC